MALEKIQLFLIFLICRLSVAVFAKDGVIKNFKLEKLGENVLVLLCILYLFTKQRIYNLNNCSCDDRNVEIPELIIYDYSRTKIASNLVDGKRIIPIIFLFNCLPTGIFHLI